MKYLLRGMGGHARTIIDILPADSEIIGYFDDIDQRNDMQWLGSYNTSVHDDVSVILSVGNNALRQKWFEETKHPLAIVIAQSAVISSSATIGEGSVVLPNSVIQNGVSIGEGAIINIGALIDHDTTLGKFCHIAAGAVVGSRCTIGERVTIGVGAVIPPASNIPDDTAIEAGVVYNDTNR